MSSATKFLMQILILLLPLQVMGQEAAAPKIKDKEKEKERESKVEATKDKGKDKNAVAAEAQCRRLFVKYGIPWQQLWSKRSPDLRDEHTAGLSQISDMTADHCSEDVSRKDLLSTLAHLLNKHSGRIGLILPTSKPLAKSLIRGVEAAVRNANLDPSKTLVIIDSQSKPQKTEHAIAQLMFQYQVSAVLGAFEASDRDTLKQWGSKLLVPTFILNEPLDKDPPQPFVYYAHPTEKALAAALVAGNERYNHKKISIMRPNDQRADNLVRHYEHLAKAAGITVLHNVVYDAKRIDQMEAAAKKLFKLEANDRTDELKRLYEQAKQHAASTGATFNPKMVALQPVMDQDAVMIVDHFRNVRHMAKVFTYLGVRKLPMFGHYEWRSEGLIDPFDPLFAKSYFVDFIGSYNNIPSGLKVATTSSPFFIQPDKVEDIDFALVGYRAIEVPLQLSKRKDTPRRKLEKLIPKPTNTSTPKDITFDSNHTISWPTYLFEVVAQGKTGTIQLQP